jgi:hypothetical protein
VSLVIVSPAAIFCSSALRTACDNEPKITASSSPDVASAAAVRYFFLVLGSAVRLRGSAQKAFPHG